MSRKRRLSSRVVVMVAVLVAPLLMIVPAPTAWAGPYDDKCDTNEVCVFQNANFNRPKSGFLYGYEDYGGCPDCHTYNSPSTCNNIFSAKCLLNDSISSMKNLSYNRHVKLFTNSQYRGYSQVLYARTQASQVKYNDAYSSHCWDDVSYCPF